MLVVPGFGGWLALLEEKEIRPDGCVRLEDRVRESDNGVEVALLHQHLLEPSLHAFTEE